MRNHTTISGETYRVVGDYQQKRVYAWERKHVAPFDTAKISIETAEQIVNYVWAEEGLQHPPKVEYIRDKRARSATGCRLKVRFPDGLLYSWVVLHELAHAMTSNVDGASCQHGPKYMKVYINLLHKYQRLDYLQMKATAKMENVDVKA